MKLAIVYPEIDQSADAMGWVEVGETIAIARALSQEVSLAHPREFWPDEAFVDWLKGQNPDVILFYLLPRQLAAVQRLGPHAREAAPRAALVALGPLPTHHPEAVMDEASVDDLIRGEWQTAFGDLLRRMAEGESTDDAPNCWKRTRDGVTKNMLKPLVTDADDVPTADLSLFDRRLADIEFGAAYPARAALGTRFESALSPTSALAAIYRGRGKFHRPRSPRAVVRALAEVKREIGFRRVRFVDELFPNDLDWLSAFVPLFRERLDCPFEIDSCVEDLREDSMLNFVKAADCDLVWIDVGVGSPELRKQILRHNLDDEALVAVVEDMRERGLRFGLKITLGVPGETSEDLKRSNDLIGRLRPDEVRAVPYKASPGARVFEQAREKGQIGRRSRQPMAERLAPDETLVEKPVSREETLRVCFRAVKISLLRRLAAGADGAGAKDFTLANGFESSEHRLREPSQIDVRGVEIDDQSLTAFLQRPPVCSEFPIKLGEESWLHFRVGIPPCSWSSPARMLTRVRVEVIIDKSRTNVFERVLDPFENIHDRQWLKCDLDLSAFHSERARVALSAVPASPWLPASRLWVAWGDVRVESPEEAAREAQTGGGDTGTGAHGVSETSLRKRMEDLEIENQLLIEEITNKSRRAGELAVRVNELEGLLAKRDEELERAKGKGAGETGGKTDRDAGDSDTGGRSRIMRMFGKRDE